MAINFKNTIFFPQRAYFVGIDMVKGGNKPPRSKRDKLRDMAPPELFCDWRMITGLFRLDQKTTLLVLIISNSTERQKKWTKIT